MHVRPTIAACIIEPGRRPPVVTSDPAFGPVTLVRLTFQPFLDQNSEKTNIVLRAGFILFWPQRQLSGSMVEDESFRLESFFLVWFGSSDIVAFQITVQKGYCY